MAKNTAGRAVVQGQLYAIGGTNLSTFDGLSDVSKYDPGDEHLVAGALLARSALLHGERGCRQHDLRCRRARHGDDRARQR